MSAPRRSGKQPRHAAVPVRSDAPVLGAPGLAALLRRHPRRIRQAAAGSIAAGVVLFVVAGLTGTTATATLGAVPRPSSHPATSPALPVAVDPPAPVSWPHPATRRDDHQRIDLRAGAQTIKAEHRRPAPATPKVISGLAANGIPKVALNAYRVAAARMDNADPSCGIDWALLAGIGREESDHGRFGGAVLNSDGTSTPRIIGPALDGVRWDYVPAPADGAQLDGDPTYAHALGPMQFIPQTWASYGVDANGDGIADVFNINDAALGAARYLCAAGGDLRTHSGVVAAILAYNHSGQYLAQVLALAAAYRSGTPIIGIPVGQITGALPPVTQHPTLPVNPGVPTANQPRHHTHKTTQPGRNRRGARTTGSKRPSSGAGSRAAGSATSSSGGSSGGTGTDRRSTAAPSPSKQHTPTPTPTHTRTPSPTPPTPTPSPSPSPSKTCHLPLGDKCLIP